MGKRYFTEFDVRRAIMRAGCDDIRLAREARLRLDELWAIRDGDRSPTARLCSVLGFTPVTRYIRTRKRKAA